MNQFDAARRGNLQQLRATLTLNNVNDVDRESGCTVLHHAACDGYVDCVKLCIEMGANVNARSLNGSTPLHIASFGSGNVNVVRVLLETGAMVDATNNDRRAPLFCYSLQIC
jgi:ankyrin repeat protein